MGAAHDPRPLTAEPLALDLVDTVWIDDAGDRHDLLTDRDLRSAWLARWGLPETGGSAQASHLADAREAIRGVLERPGRRATAALNAVLARGRLRVSFDGTELEETLEAPVAWQPAWRAALDLSRLLSERPERVKRCANPACVLWFEDTTRSNTRRWCSMTGGCGSRLKARRHAARVRPTR